MSTFLRLLRSYKEDFNQNIKEEVDKRAAGISRSARRRFKARRARVKEALLARREERTGRWVAERERRWDKAVAAAKVRGAR